MEKAESNAKGDEHLAGAHDASAPILFYELPVIHMSQIPRAARPWSR